MMLEGVRLMAVGMLTVFTFLTLLVALMHASARFFAAHAERFPDPVSDPDPGAGDESDRALAIALAWAARQREESR